MSSNLHRIIRRCVRSTIRCGKELTPAARVFADGLAQAYFRAASIQGELPFNAGRFLAAEGVVGVPK